jgi:ADP-ribose pyrophosphatase YjhB (NUDIX family)
MKVQELNVYVVASFNDKILLMRRHDGWWEFPGGSVDWGEDPIKAAEREFKEETQLIVSNLKFVGVTSATYKKEEDEKHSVYIVYSGETNSDKFIISGEHAEARWLMPQEAKYMKLGLNAEPVLDLI